MTRQEAVRELQRRHVDETHYVVEGLTGAPRAEGAVYLAQHSDGWEVGVQERGQREAHQVLASEDEACRLLLALLSGPTSQPNRPWWLRWT